VEEYEFCPVQDKGLKRYINYRQPSCGYEVINNWKREFIKDLKDKNLLTKIDHWGLLNRSDVNNDILEIVKEFSSRCPANFSLDINNSPDSKNQFVYCTKVSFSCPPWYRTSPKKDGDFFGCQRYASCEETNPLSYEIDDPRYCALCPAGGCIDHTKTETDWSENKIGYCRVNEANPQQSVGCNE
jgi:hypothetical protein